MDLAERFRLPVLIFIDTRRRVSGIGAEERGQAEAIARTSRRASPRLPNIAVMIGEGGSGGASGSRPRAASHAAVRLLQRHLAGGRRFDPVARLRSRAQDAATAMKITAAGIARPEVMDGDDPRAARRGAPRPDDAIGRDGEAMARALARAGRPQPPRDGGERDARIPRQLGRRLSSRDLAGPPHCRLMRGR